MVDFSFITKPISNIINTLYNSTKPTSNTNWSQSALTSAPAPNSGLSLVPQKSSLTGHAARVADDHRNAQKIHGSQTSSSSGSGITDQQTAGQDTLSGEGGSVDGGTGEIGDTSSGGNSGGSGGSSSGSGGATSPLLEGSMTFEELVGEICNGIDLIFVCKRSTVVVTDYETLYAEAKYLRDNYHDSVVAEDIALWQLEDGSYELDVNEYGFYNTVIINYKNGVIEESYEDLVRVFGKVPITYTEKKLDKTSAIMKAKAYLAAHVRDFDMSVKATLLHDADIDIGDIVTLENPMTMRNQYRKDYEKRDPEYFFVMGNSIEWEGDGGILNNIELRYGAKSPEKKEVPETGASYSQSSESSITGDIETAIDEVGKMAAKITYSGACQTHSCVKDKKTGDCWGMSDFIACELQSRGVNAKIYEYAAIASNHRSVKYQDSTGQWARFPYRKYGVSTLFRDTDGVEHGREVSSTCGGGSS